MNLDELVARVAAVSEEDKAELVKLVALGTGNAKWTPTAGPQADAYYSKADVLLYGGQAGGGKTALLTGLALTQHQNSLIIRRQYGDLGSLIKDTLYQYGTRDGFNGSPPAKLVTEDGRQIDFGGAKTPGDEEHWKGRPHDFLALDEATQFLESQFRFLSGWLRSISRGQRCRIVLATNPPDRPDVGRWVFEMFAPWLDPAHPHPAKPGELRWYIADEEGNDKEVDGPEQIEIGGRLVKPLSRTFIPARLSDNPFLADTGYDAQLDNLPEPLRSAVRDGNWTIAHEDDPWQVIPTVWVMQAQERWTDKPPEHAPMCAIGVDVAQGGASQTALAPRYDAWFAPLIVVPGRDTPLGTDVAGLVVKHRRNKAVIIIDMGGGYGGAALEHLKANDLPVHGYKGAEGSGARTADRQLGFLNKRAESWWRLREALDPDQQGGSPMALPPDQALLADLVAPRWEMTPRGIKVELKEDIVKRLGRSPDRGDAVVMAWSRGAIVATHGQIWRRALKSQHRPQVLRGHESKRRRS